MTDSNPVTVMELSIEEGNGSSAEKENDLVRERRKWLHKNKYVWGLVIFGVVLGIFAICAVSLVLAGSSVRVERELCGSRECNRTARMIRAMMNQSVNPCEDFFQVNF